MHIKQLGTMTAVPHHIARNAFQMHAGQELGIHVPLEMEQKAVRLVGGFLNTPQTAGGHIVSGGTEANIIALWAARERKKIPGGEVVFPITSHYSILRACRLLGLTPRPVSAGFDYTVDVEKLKNAITENTVAVVATAGTTSLGVIDDIPRIAEFALAAGIPLHVDAAYGGFVFPFMKKLGYDLLDFDFSVDGVTSITIDPHKMGLVPPPTGCIIFRDCTMLDSLRPENVLYYPAASSVIAGTRPASPTMATLAVIEYLGENGYKEIVKTCLELTNYFYDRLKELKTIKAVMKPVCNIIGIRSEKLDTHSLKDYLETCGWGVFEFSEWIRIIIMPHLTQGDLVKLIMDLKKID
ncbi:MAG: tyrosine decarboxylase MfnA [Candidatus Micrarchaeota archaeon]|nr:tyrosine decarboxylase MfnA [Candidatus Micrarchaeota archaeon]